MTDYQYPGALAMVELHEHHLREFVSVWQDAKARGLALPETDDPAYATLDDLLHHVLACARGYLVWSCAKLGLPEPSIDPAPGATELATRAETYADHVAAGWRHPLAGTPEDDFGVEYEAPWRVHYCVDAMLEHAVMHPIRHTHQLRKLLA